MMCVCVCVLSHMSSLLQLVTLMTIPLCLLYTLTHVYTLGALVSAFSDKVWVTLISPLILWDSLAPLRLHSSPSFTLMVCLQPLYLPVSAGWAQPSIAQSSLLVLIQHKPFLPLYSVLPRPSAVPMHTSPAGAAATRLHFVPSGEGSLRKQKQLRASLPAYNE